MTTIARHEGPGVHGSSVFEILHRHRRSIGVTVGAVLLSGGAWLAATRGGSNPSEKPQPGRGDVPVAAAPLSTHEPESELGTVDPQLTPAASASTSPEAQASEAPTVGHDSAYFCTTLGKFANQLTKTKYGPNAKPANTACDSEPERGIESEYAFDMGPDGNAVSVMVVDLRNTEPVTYVNGAPFGFLDMKTYREKPDVHPFTVNGHQAGCTPTGGQIGVQTGLNPTEVATFDVVAGLGPVGGKTDPCNGAEIALRMLAAQMDK